MDILMMLTSIALSLVAFVFLYIAFNWEKVMDIYRRGRGR